MINRCSSCVFFAGFEMLFFFSKKCILKASLVDTRLELNKHYVFLWRAGCQMNVLCTINLARGSTSVMS